MIQMLSKACLLQPDFGCNSDWLISSKSIFDWLKLILHKIYLATVTKISAVFVVKLLCGRKATGLRIVSGSTT